MGLLLFFTGLCLIRTILPIPTSNPQALIFRIAPGVEKILFNEAASASSSTNLPFMLGHIESSKPNAQRIRVESRPFTVGRDPNAEDVTSFFVSEGSGSSDEILVEQTSPYGIPLLGEIDKNIASEIGSGNLPIAFPTVTPVFSNSTVPSDSQCKFSNGVVYYKNKCERLLVEEACSEGEWLILNKKGLPECVERPCPVGQLKYNICVNITDSSVCGVNEILYIDFSARVYCDCQHEFVYDVRNRQCYAEHERGSCAFGYYLELNPQGNVQCVINPCQRDDLLLDPETKKCFKKLFKGRCNQNVASLFFEDDGTATCTSLTIRNIFEVPALSSCPAGSQRDYFGVCRTAFRFDSSDPSSFRVPSQFTSRYTYCPPNYLKYPDGTCKKTNEILGG